MASGVWNIAHRGASAERPENTLPAFERGIEQGADVIECDVRQAADGTLFLMHDVTVDRTTDGTGPLRALSPAQVEALDAGDGARVPRLEEVLRLARGRVRVNVDLKELDGVQAAVTAAERCDMLHAVTFISFLPDACDVARSLAPACPVVQLVDTAAALAGLVMGDVGSQGGVTGIGLPNAFLTPELVGHVQRHGRGVFVWTVDDEAEMRRAVEAGVNGIVTNRPAALAEVLRQMGRRREAA